MKKEPVRTCSGIPQLVAEEAGLDYDPVKLHGWDSRVDLQRGSHRASLLHVYATLHLRLIRKVVAKRTFEAHDLMFRSYYENKKASSSPLGSLSAEALLSLSILFTLFILGW